MKHVSLDIVYTTCVIFSPSPNGFAPTRMQVLRLAKKECNLDALDSADLSCQLKRLHVLALWDLESSQGGCQCTGFMYCR